MATAMLTAIKHGAGRVQGTVQLIVRRHYQVNVTLEEVAVALKIREDFSSKL